MIYPVSPENSPLWTAVMMEVLNSLGQLFGLINLILAMIAILIFGLLVRLCLSEAKGQMRKNRLSCAPLPVYRGSPRIPQRLRLPQPVRYGERERLELR
jgi:hypothetical protein